MKYIHWTAHIWSFIVKFMSKVVTVVWISAFPENNNLKF